MNETASGGGVRAQSRHTEFQDRSGTVSDALRRLARDVRRIGGPYRATPEDIALAKDGIATELATIARDLESGR